MSGLAYSLLIICPPPPTTLTSGIESSTTDLPTTTLASALQSSHNTKTTPHKNTSETDQTEHSMDLVPTGHPIIEFVCFTSTSARQPRDGTCFGFIQYTGTYIDWWIGIWMDRHMHTHTHILPPTVSRCIGGGGLFLSSLPSFPVRLFLPLPPKIPRSRPPAPLDSIHNVA
jgi:hypothetical protein